MSTNIPPDPFEGFISVKREIAPNWRSIFKNDHAVDNLFRNRGDELVELGIAAKIGGEWCAQPNPFLEYILDFMKRGEGVRPPRNNKAA